MSVTYVGVGTLVSGDHNDVLSPTIHANVEANDFLIAYAFLRNAGTLTISDGWTLRHNTDTTQVGASFYLSVWYKWATGSDTAPSITPVDGVTSPQSLAGAAVMAFRGVSPINPWGNNGDDSFNTTSTSIGPIAAAKLLYTGGAAFVFGARCGSAATAIATLTGDGLTWAEVGEIKATVNSLGITVAMNYALWDAIPQTFTAKTYSLTGGAGGPGMGKMFTLNDVASQITAYSEEMTHGPLIIIDRKFKRRRILPRDERAFLLKQILEEEIN